MSLILYDDFAELGFIKIIEGDNFKRMYNCFHDTDRQILLLICCSQHCGCFPTRKNFQHRNSQGNYIALLPLV